MASRMDRGCPSSVVSANAGTSGGGGGGGGAAWGGDGARDASEWGGGGACADVRFAGGFVGEEALLHDDRVAPWTCMAADWSELLLLRGADMG